MDNERVKGMIYLKTSNLCSADKTVSNLDKLIKKMLSMPYWVKQYIYKEIRDDLCKYTKVENIDKKDKNDLVQMYVATPGATAQRYLRRKSTGFVPPTNIDPDILAFLRSLGPNVRLIDICNLHQWSLIKVCRVLVNAIDQGLVEHIENNQVANTVYYVAGKIRLGEYLLRMNKLSLEQVDHALYTQHQIAKQMGGETTKMGEVLVNLGYIEEEDKNEILSLKDNSNHIFQMIDESEKLKAEIAQLKAQIEVLNLESQALKDDVNFYQEEICKKATSISNLSDEIMEMKKSKFQLRNLFNFQLTPKNT